MVANYETAASLQPAVALVVAGEPTTVRHSIANRRVPWMPVDSAPGGPRNSSMAVSGGLDDHGPMLRTASTARASPRNSSVSALCARLATSCRRTRRGLTGSEPGTSSGPTAIRRELKTLPSGSPRGTRATRLDVRLAGGAADGDHEVAAARRRVVYGWRTRTRRDRVRRPTRGAPERPLADVERAAARAGDAQLQPALARASRDAQEQRRPSGRAGAAGRPRRARRAAGGRPRSVASAPVDAQGASPANGTREPAGAEEHDRVLAHDGRARQRTRGQREDDDAPRARRTTIGLSRARPTAPACSDAARPLVQPLPAVVVRERAQGLHRHRERASSGREPRAARRSPRAGTGTAAAARRSSCRGPQLSPPCHSLQRPMKQPVRERGRGRRRRRPASARRSGTRARARPPRRARPA